MNTATIADGGESPVTVGGMNMPHADVSRGGHVTM